LQGGKHCPHWQQDDQVELCCHKKLNDDIAKSSKMKGTFEQNEYRMFRKKKADRRRSNLLQVVDLPQAVHL
jgi:hypothetical protein